MYHESDPLLLENRLGSRRDASRSAIMSTLRQAYLETRNDGSREWTSQVESLWAEEYKDETGMLHSWQRKKRKKWEDDFINSRFRFSYLEEVSYSEQKGKEEYLKAKQEGEDVDFEMNDLFWRLSVRRFAVRAQLVDIV